MPDYVITANTTPVNAPGGATHLTGASAVSAWIESPNPDTNNYPDTRVRCAWSTVARQNGLLTTDFAGLPGGESIVSATLYLYAYFSNGDATKTYTVHELLQAWVAGEVTWNNRSTGNAWNTAGALGAGTDYTSTADGTDTQDVSTAGWVALDVTDYVTNVHGGGTNHGLLVLQNPQDGSVPSGTQFGSETRTSGQRWELVIATSAGGASHGLTADAAAFSVSGTPADLRAGRALVANSASIVLTGTAAELVATLRLIAESGAFSLTGTDANLSALNAYTLTAEGGGFALTGTAAELFLGLYMLAEMGVIQMDADDVSLTVGYGIVADSGSFSLAGAAADLESGRRVAAEAGAISLAGALASLLADRSLDAAAGAFALTGADVDLATAGALVADAGSYQISGTAADLLRAAVLSGESGAFSLAGTEVTLTGTGSHSLDAESGTYQITGAAAELLRAATLSGESGAFELTGTDLSFLVGRVIEAEAGAFTITGASATLTYSGSNVAPATISLTGVFNPTKALTGHWH